MKNRISEGPTGPSGGGAAGTRRGGTVPLEVLRVTEGSRRRRRDRVATEEPLEIRLLHGPAAARASRPVAVTMRTPGQDLELAAGFLFTEGILQRADDLEGMRACTGTVASRGNVVEARLAPHVEVDEHLVLRHFQVTSSCGVCGKASLEAVERRGCGVVPLAGFGLPSGVVRALPEALTRAQKLFHRTGGLHGAALCDAEGRLSIAREDVGRHNAVDKVIGERLMAGRLPLADQALVVSGRASFEIVQKAVAAGVPVVVAVGAPSSLAVDLARRFQVTLVGFARPEGFNVYTWEERVR